MRLRHEIMAMITAMISGTCFTSGITDAIGSKALIMI
jgi:hypothetical protein